MVYKRMLGTFIVALVFSHADVTRTHNKVVNYVPSLHFSRHGCLLLGYMAYERSDLIYCFSGEYRKQLRRINRDVPRCFCSSGTFGPLASVRDFGSTLNLLTRFFFFFLVCFCVHTLWFPAGSSLTATLKRKHGHCFSCVVIAGQLRSQLPVVGLVPGAQREEVERQPVQLYIQSNPAKASTLH